MTAVPMATGAMSPVWPLPDVTRKRWTFGASRAKGKRRHAGIDLYALRGSVVLAPEAGTIVATQRFNGPLAHAILLQTDSGVVILFGEVEPNSWRKYGLVKGSRVERGAPVADVGINPGGDQMLHLETYVAGTRKNQRWFTGKQPPAALLNPTRYLKSANALDTDQADDVGDDSDDAGEVDDDDTNDDHADDIAQNDTIPNDTIPADPNGFGGGALLGLGIVFLMANAMESGRRR